MPFIYTVCEFFASLLLQCERWGALSLRDIRKKNNKSDFNLKNKKVLLGKAFQLLQNRTRLYCIIWQVYNPMCVHGSDE